MNFRTNTLMLDKNFAVLISTAVAPQSPQEVAYMISGWFNEEKNGNLYSGMASRQHYRDHLTKIFVFQLKYTVVFILFI